MNTHRILSLLAAVLITAGQAALLAVDSHARVPGNGAVYAAAQADRSPAMRGA